MKELLEMGTIIKSKEIYDYNNILFNIPIVIGLIVLLILTFIGGCIVTKHINKDKKLIVILLDFFVFLFIGGIVFISSIGISVYLTDNTKTLQYAEYTISFNKSKLYEAEEYIKNNNIQVTDKLDSYTYTVRIEN